MADGKTPFHNPFGALAGLGGSRPAPADRQEAAAPARTPVTKTVARAVVRLERSGRRGKEVTVVEHLDVAPGDLERWLRDLKGSLGCGGSVEGAAIVLQGDHRRRLVELLTARGVKKVTRG